MRSGDVEDVKNAQGWTDATLIDLALSFIAEQGSEDHFVKWLQLRADSENSEEGVSGPLKCAKCHEPDSIEGQVNPENNLCQWCEEDEIAHGES